MDPINQIAVADVQTYSSWGARSIQQALHSQKCSISLPPVESLICIIQKCRADRNLALAKRMHVHIHGNGLEVHKTIGNYLIPMLVECGGISDAQQAFYRLPYRNEHAWTSLIQGFVNCGECQHALTLFEEMQEDCVYPSKFTLQALLKACARLKYLEKGWQIHAEIFMAGYEVDPFVGNTLVDMYAKCGSFMEAWEVFCMLPGRDVVTWNALMSGCTEHMLCEEALRHSNEMRLMGFCPSIVTFLCILKACSNIEALEKGQGVHAEIVAEGLEKDCFIGNALVDMYAKCDSLIEALHVFAELTTRGVDSWNALITGYSEQGLGEEALSCLDQMQLEGVAPNEITFMCSLKVCGNAGLIDKGRQLHGNVVKEGLQMKSCLCNTLVDMYGKCGALSEAQQVFDTLVVQDLVSWNALLAGYARQGESEAVFSSIEMMIHEGVQPDWITFLSALSVCNHNGLVSVGQDCFELMIDLHGIIPTVRHHSCIINLFGRAGQLNEGLNALAKLSGISKTGTGCRAYQTRHDLQAHRDPFRWATRSVESDVGACALLSDDPAAFYSRQDVEDFLECFAKVEAWKGQSKSLWWE